MPLSKSHSESAESALPAIQLLGGEANLKEKLVSALTEKRKELNIEAVEIDSQCRIGQYYNVSATKKRRETLGKSAENIPETVPSFSEVESTPSNLTAQIFSRVSTLLGVKANRVLKSDLRSISDEQLDSFLGSNHSSAMACGGGSFEKVTKEERAHLLIVLQALESIKS